jgi:hypothetical protein
MAKGCNLDIHGEEARMTVTTYQDYVPPTMTPTEGSGKVYLRFENLPKAAGGLRRVHPVDLTMHTPNGSPLEPPARRVHTPLWLPH